VFLLGEIELWGEAELVLLGGETGVRSAVFLPRVGIGLSQQVVGFSADRRQGVGSFQLQMRLQSDLVA
jgi:hypothetical protein